MITKRRKKEIEEQMRQRAFDLRVSTGRGWTRDQLMKDEVWKKLNNELEAK